MYRPIWNDTRPLVGRKGLLQNSDVCRTLRMVHRRRSSRSSITWSERRPQSRKQSEVRERFCTNSQNAGTRHECGARDRRCGEQQQFEHVRRNACSIHHSQRVRKRPCHHGSGNHTDNGDGNVLYENGEYAIMDKEKITYEFDASVRHLYG